MTETENLCAPTHSCATDNSSATHVSSILLYLNTKIRKNWLSKLHFFFFSWTLTENTFMQQCVRSSGRKTSLRNFNNFDNIWCYFSSLNSPKKFNFYFFYLQHKQISLETESYHTTQSVWHIGTCWGTCEVFVHVANIETIERKYVY